MGSLLSLASVALHCPVEELVFVMSSLPDVEGDDLNLMETNKQLSAVAN